MDRGIMLIDVNNIGYAAMYQPSLAHLQTSQGQNTAAIFGFFYSFLSLMQKFPGRTPLMLWDSPQSWRKEILPTYKDNRADTPEKVNIREAYFKQQEKIKTLAALLGIPQASEAEFEADDIVAFCVSIKENDYLGISSDTDWWQGLGSNFSIFSPRNKELITSNNFPALSERYGQFEDPIQFILAKAIAGDKSDNIPGIEGVGIKGASVILEGYFYDLEQLKNDSTTKSKKVKSIQEGWDIVTRNIQLMSWESVRDLMPEIELVTMEPQIEDFYAQCDQLEMAGIKKSYKYYARYFSESKNWQKNVQKWLSPIL